MRARLMFMVCWLYVAQMTLRASVDHFGCNRWEPEEECEDWDGPEDDEEDLNFEREEFAHGQCFRYGIC